MILGIKDLLKKKSILTSEGICACPGELGNAFSIFLTYRAWERSLRSASWGWGLGRGLRRGWNSPPSVWHLHEPTASFYSLRSYSLCLPLQGLLHKSPRKEVAFHSLLKHKLAGGRAPETSYWPPSILLGLVGPSESFPSSSWVPARQHRSNELFQQGHPSFSHTAATLYTLFVSFSRQLESSLLFASISRLRASPACRMISGSQVWGTFWECYLGFRKQVEWRVVIRKPIRVIQFLMDILKDEGGLGGTEDTEPLLLMGDRALAGGLKRERWAYLKAGRSRAARSTGCRRRGGVGCSLLWVLCRVLLAAGLPLRKPRESQNQRKAAEYPGVSHQRKVYRAST